VLVVLDRLNPLWASIEANSGKSKLWYFQPLPLLVVGVVDQITLLQMVVFREVLVAVRWRWFWRG
jgi:hypothetical protein